MRQNVLLCRFKTASSLALRALTLASFRLLFLPCLTANLIAAAGFAADDNRDGERRAFQTNASWSPRLNLDSDVAIVYGIDKRLPARIESWRSRGYGVHVMTGVSWGDYGDYLEGRFDGTVHDDEGQTTRDGNRIMHGIGRGIYYICPTESYAQYLCAGVRNALDAGVQAIHLEEPEFWARGGYSGSFKRAWKDYYREEWMPPHTSVDAQYRASKLKYVLFQRALSQVFRYVHDYNAKHGTAVRCYVPSHSLLNYAQWDIVSPESSLLGVGCDGFIAQVWTGTARTPNVYEGRSKERTFETAFLEYGAMQNLVRASGKRVWYLNDPIEDNPNRSWIDYRRNWENTLVASLLQPEVWRYEVAPWPERILHGKYPPDDAALKLPQESRPRIAIPRAYESELQTVFHALGEMKQPSDSIRWQTSGMPGVGVLVSDTIMFQRGDPSPSERWLSSFYGLAMPLLKRGVPVEPVQLEFAGIPNYLAPYRVLLLTYEGQKPPRADLHASLVQWVEAGGALVVFDDDRDPYLAVREWWNSDGNAFRTPRQHLFKMLGLPEDAVGQFAVGKGVVVRASLSPAALAYEKLGGQRVRDLVRQAAEKIGQKWRESNALVLHRGPFVVAAGLSESTPEAKVERLEGHFIDLFDAELKTLRTFDLTPDARALLVDVDALAGKQAAILAASCRVRAWQCTKDRASFATDGIVGSEANVVLSINAPPRSVTVDEKTLPPESSVYADGILRLKYPNASDPSKIEVLR